MVNDSELEVAAAVCSLRKPVVQSNLCVGIVGIPDDPEVPTGNLRGFDAHLGLRWDRTGGRCDHQGIKGAARAQGAHDESCNRSGSRTTVGLD
jgi:hypothetical protein